MNEIIYPSNTKFGFFFSFLFFISSCFCLYIQKFVLFVCLFVVCLFFLGFTIFNPDLLFPINKIYMKFGLLLGKIVSPIVMAFIFFGLITPYAIIMRIMGRDELRLRKLKTDSFWINRSKNSIKSDFKQQF